MEAIHRSCPLCAADEPQAVLTSRDVNYGTPGEYSVVRCPACGMLYTDPHLPPAELLQRYPAEYTAHAGRGARRARRGRSRRDPWERVAVFGQGRLLDIGCGDGSYLVRQTQAGWTGVGIEPIAAAVRAARARGLEVVQGTLPGVELGPRRFELVTLLGVVGTLPHPLGTLRAARGMLTVGGLLMVSTHNAASAARERLGSRWWGWDLPRGLNHFTPPTLAELLRRAGFDRIELGYRPRPHRWRRAARALEPAPRGLFWRAVGGWGVAGSAAVRWVARGARADEVWAICRT